MLILSVLYISCSSGIKLCKYKYFLCTEVHKATCRPTILYICVCALWDFGNLCVCVLIPPGWFSQTLDWNSSQPQRGDFHVPLSRLVWNIKLCVIPWLHPLVRLTSSWLRGKNCSAGSEVMPDSHFR